jgi:hypothetical protein
VYKIDDVVVGKKIYREDGGLSFTVPIKDGEMLVYYETKDKGGIKLYIMMKKLLVKQITIPMGMLLLNNIFYLAIVHSSVACASTVANR